MAKIKVIIKRPDEQYGHVTHISASLENLQKTVGGYIEFCCGNENSDEYGVPTFYDDTCDEWSEKE